MGKMRLIQRQKVRASLQQRIMMRLNIQQKQKITLRKVIYFSALISAICSSVFIALNLGAKKEAVAGGTTKFTLSNGEWSNQIWSNTSSTGATCNCDPGNNYNGPGITIAHQIVSSVYNPLKISGGGYVNILLGSSLVINGDFELNGGSIVNIEASDTVIVNGNATISGGSTVNLGSVSFLKINGNVTLSGGSKVTGPGGASHSGAVSGSGWGPGVVLPIELIYFKAENTGEEVNLTWATSSEKNNDYFTIERSADGKLFEEVSRKQGAGNSNSKISYSVLDNQFVNKGSYYRLKQTDYNGHYTYSRNVMVKNNSGKDHIDLLINSIAPNPVTDQFTIDYSVKNEGQVVMQIVNKFGTIIDKKSLNSNKGSNSYIYNKMADLPNGVYFVSLIFDDKKETKKIVKL